MVREPLAPVDLELLGSDSQVTAPLNLRIYLYSKLVLAGRVTVTMRNDSGNMISNCSDMKTYRSRWGS